MDDRKTILLRKCKLVKFDPLHFYSFKTFRGKMEPLKYPNKWLKNSIRQKKFTTLTKQNHGTAGHQEKASKELQSTLKNLNRLEFCFLTQLLLHLPQVLYVPQPP
jgi:hypothetical protein